MAKKTLEEVDPHEIKGSSGRRTDIECESSDEEEEYTSDECEDDDEDGAELDISSSYMVHGAQSGSSSGRSNRRRGLFQASGLSEFTPPNPRVPAVGPSSMSPPVAAGSSEFTPPNPRVPTAGPSSVSPPIAASICWSFLCPSSGSSRLRSVCTFSSYSSRHVQCYRMLLVYTRGKSNHRFTRRSDEARFRLIWTTTARSNFKHLLYNARKNAEKVCQSADPTLWREHALTWMRRDYWESLCNIWAAERWQQTSTTMKVNRTANPEANMHTSGSVSFATHQSRLGSHMSEKELKRPPTFQEVFDKTHKKKGMDLYISERAREVAESYSQQMTKKHVGEKQL
ncbi:hypothetical protein Taro_012357 [Colocasia esculenta]|uniref:Uncharacterized protein n=1 Tax=Colocasia esculenta TaxID=4460 RepID=A0A843U3S4_COLES|nr:hypothetical protein [Colocasia esculenta]